MDTIDRVVGQAWGRKHKSEAVLPVAEKHNVHLRIRNPQYRRETPERRAAYLHVTENRTPKKAEYNVRTEYVDSVSNETYKEALKKPGETKKIVAALETEEKALRGHKEKLEKYLASEASVVKSQWQYDIEKDFRDRNQQMLVRFDHLIARTIHLAEQVRRETPSLLMEYTLPAYDVQLARLKAIRDKNKKIIVRTSVGATTAAAGTVGFVYRKEIMDGIRELTNSDRQ